MKNIDNSRLRESPEKVGVLARKYLQGESWRRPGRHLELFNQYHIIYYPSLDLPYILSTVNDPLWRVFDVVGASRALNYIRYRRAQNWPKCRVVWRVRAETFLVGSFTFNEVRRAVRSRDYKRCMDVLKSLKTSNLNPEYS